jgi:hypothetical protein
MAATGHGAEPELAKDKSYRHQLPTINTNGLSTLLSDEEKYWANTTESIHGDFSTLAGGGMYLPSKVRLWELLSRYGIEFTTLFVSTLF